MSQSRVGDILIEVNDEQPEGKFTFSAEVGWPNIQVHTFVIDGDTGLPTDGIIGPEEPYDLRGVFCSCCGETMVEDEVMQGERWYFCWHCMRGVWP